MIIWLRNLLLSACSVGVILVAVIIPGTTAYAQEITATGAPVAVISCAYAVVPGIMTATKITPTEHADSSRLRNQIIMDFLTVIVESISI